MHALVGHRNGFRLKGAHQSAPHHGPSFFQTFQMADAIREQSSHSCGYSRIGHGNGQFLNFRMLARDGLPNLHLPRQSKFLAQGGHLLAQQIHNFMVSLLLIRHDCSLCNRGHGFGHRHRRVQWREGRIDGGHVHHWRSLFFLGRR